MNRQSLFIILMTFGLGSASAQTLSYIADSSGLMTVNFDGGTSEMEFADINADGHLDILSIGDHGSPYVNTQQHGIMVYFGNGTGSNWSLYQEGNFGYGGIATGDVNNDGFMDVGYGMHHNYNTSDFGDQVLEVALGNGTGMGWIPWDDSLGLNGQTWGMSGTDLGDFDNDGWLDIGSNAFGCCDGLHLYRNLQNGKWVRTFGFTGGNSNHKFRFGDIDNDGRLDFVVARQGGTAYFGDGMGGFSLKGAGLPASGIVGYTDLALADVDNDGTQEMAFISSGLLYLYKWSHGMQSWQSMAGMPTATSNLALGLKDMNSDGFIDLLTMRSGLMTIYLGDGGTSWTQGASLSLPAFTSVKDLDIDDCDHNGFPDVIMLATYTTGPFSSVNRLRLYRETSVPTNLMIKPLYPKGVECFEPGSVRFIDWVSAVPPSMSTSVSIEFSLTGSTGPWGAVASGIPNNGRYQWTVPFLTSPDCHFRFIVTDNLSAAADTAVTFVPFKINCGFLTGQTTTLQEYNSIHFAPNPASANVYLGFGSNLPGGSKLEVLDLAGRKVITELLSTQSGHMVDINNLSPGLYMLQVLNKLGITHRGKLVVE